jgi:hypothetical protein
MKEGALARARVGPSKLRKCSLPLMYCTSPEVISAFASTHR